MDPTLDPIVARCRNAIKDAWQAGYEAGMRAAGIEQIPTETIIKEKEDDSFNLIWAMYQHKISKAAAQRAWSRLKPADRKLAIAGCDRYVKRTDPTGQAAPYRAHLATWLNGRRWEDELPKSPCGEHVSSNTILTLD